MCKEGKPLVPSAWGLLKAVKRLVQATHVVRAASVNKAGRLLAVDLLVKSAMEKSILDVELVNWPRPRDRKAENDADHRRLNNRAECLIKINALLLRITSYHPSRLVPGKVAVRVEFMFEDPLP